MGMAAAHAFEEGLGSVQSRFGLAVTDNLTDQRHHKGEEGGNLHADIHIQVGEGTDEEHHDQQQDGKQGQNRIYRFEQRAALNGLDILNIGFPRASQASLGFSIHPSLPEEMGQCQTSRVGIETMA